VLLGHLEARARLPADEEGLRAGSKQRRDLRVAAVVEGARSDAERAERRVPHSALEVRFIDRGAAGRREDEVVGCRPARYVRAQDGLEALVNDDVPLAPAGLGTSVLAKHPAPLDANSPIAQVDVTAAERDRFRRPRSRPEAIVDERVVTRGVHARTKLVLSTIDGMSADRSGALDDGGLECWIGEVFSSGPGWPSALVPSLPAAGLGSRWSAGRQRRTFRTGGQCVASSICLATIFT